MTADHAGQPAVLCAGCQRLPAGEPLTTDGRPWAWSQRRDTDGTISLLCDRCTRANARSIEAKLDDEWW